MPDYWISVNTKKIDTCITLGDTMIRKPKNRSNHVRKKLSFDDEDQETLDDSPSIEETPVVIKRDKSKKSQVSSSPLRKAQDQDTHTSFHIDT